MHWGRVRAIALLLLAACAGCDDGGGGVDAGPVGPDMSPPPPPPPDLTGFYRARLDRTGGDCPAEVAVPPMRMFRVTSTDETVTLEGLSGARAGEGFDLGGPWRDAGCGAPTTEQWSMTVSAAGKAFAGRAVATQPACAGACTIEYTVRAERAGDSAFTEFTTLDLAEQDVAVLSGEILGDAAYFGTAARDGGRVWRLIHDAGVPFLEPLITDGFGGVGPALAGNNFAIESMVRDGERLVIGTWDATPETLAARGLELPAGDGFDLWAFEQDGWTPLTTDGFGTASHEAATALTLLDGALVVGVRDATLGARVLRLGAGPDAAPTPLYEAPPTCPAVSDLAVFDGRLHAAIECDDGVHIERWDGAQWQALSAPGIEGGAHTRAALLATDTQLLALTSSPAGAALFRYVGPMRWVAEAADGFGEQGARSGGRGLRIHDSDLLIFPTDTADGGAAWLTQGGRALRDLTRFVGPRVAEQALALAVSFERRLYLGTRGDDALDPSSFATAGPARLMRSATLLSETGSGTLRTARDRAFDAARGGDNACHRQPLWFNPVLEHDQPLSVVLPPGVTPSDIVRLPTVYVLHPTGDAAAFNANAQTVMGGVTSCLYGRRATIPCDDGEATDACLIRCLDERVPGGDGAALLAHLGLAAPLELPIIERVALVFAEYGAGIYVDSPINASGPPGSGFAPWASAIPAVAEHVERCWPLAVRGPEARYVYGFGEGGLAAGIAVEAGTFPAGIAHAPRFDIERLARRPDEARWGSLQVATGPDLLTVIDADAAGCAAQAATCSVASTCGGTPLIQAGSDADLLARAPAIADAMLWLTAIHRDADPGVGLCEAATTPDCAALPAICAQ